MRTLIWIVLLFALAVGFTLAGKYDPGYAVLVYPPYRVELSLTLMVVVFLGLLVLGHLFFRLASATLRLPEQVREFRARQREQESRAALNEALTALLEMRYNRAEKRAAEALALDTAPWQAALIAARAAHEIKAYSRRDGYLAQAEQLAPGQALARLVIEADCLLDERRAEAALTRLKQAAAIDPKHGGLQKLELRAQQMLKNWDRVLELVAALEKRQVLEPVVAEQLRLNAHQENLKLSGNNAAALAATWQKIPVADKIQPRLARTAASIFAALGETRTAIEIIEQSLAQQWDESLARAYGEIDGTDTLRQIERAEKWLPEHPRDAALLLSLGRLCARQLLWGKAQSFFEASLAIAPASETCFALAQLLEQMGRPDAACRHYRQGMTLLADARQPC